MARPVPSIDKGQKDRQTFLKLFPFLIGLILIALPVAAYFLLFAPGMARLQPGGDLDLVAKQEELDRAASELEQIKRLRESYAEVQADENFDKIDFALPSAVDLPGLFVQVEAIAVESGLKIQGLEIAEALADASTLTPPGQAAGASVLPQVPANVKKININMRVGAADYSGWKSFLQSLEKNLRLFDVTSFTFDPRSNQQNINIVTYYYKE